MTLKQANILLIGLALLCSLFVDLSIGDHNPGPILIRMLSGAITPDFFATEFLLQAVVNTIAFAVLGVSGACILGFSLTLIYRYRWVRGFCAIIRAVHELFWALIFLQLFGLNPLTGVLAILIPYTGIFAKVYAELIEETDSLPQQTLPTNTAVITQFIYTRLTQAWPHIRSYTRYRMECGLRSSAVLGFIGLPTLGFHLESWFRQGQYSQAFALLYLFFLLIITSRWWLRRSLLPVLLIASLWWMPTLPSVDASLLRQFFTHDIIPYPLRSAVLWDFNAWVQTLAWAKFLFLDQAFIGVLNTFVLSTLSLILCMLTACIGFPFISRQFFNKYQRGIGHFFLVIARSTPEYIIAYVMLVLLGPSMLPALIALGLHNGAIVGFLVGNFSNELRLRQDASRGLNRYWFEVLPRVYRTTLAYSLYRWEVIMRETAILGILGIHTLGFYIDSAFEDIRFDRAIFLIAVTALMNIMVDWFSRWLRLRLHLKATPEEL